jgi:hypothetical protein
MLGFAAVAAASLAALAPAHAAPQPLGPAAHHWTLTYQADARQLYRWSHAFGGNPPGSPGGPGITCPTSSMVRPPLPHRALRIEVRAATSNCINPWTGAGEPWRSGAVQSSGVFTQRFGGFSARVYVPGVSAARLLNWPSFWMVGASGTWPANGEMDVMEVLAGHDCWTYHYSRPGHPRAIVHGCYRTPPGWHVFTATWWARGWNVWQDGRLVGRVRRSTTRVPMIALFDHMVAASSYQQAATLRVAWFRAWRRG